MEDTIIVLQNAYKQFDIRYGQLPCTTQINTIVKYVNETPIEDVLQHINQSNRSKFKWFIAMCMRKCGYLEQAAELYIQAYRELPKYIKFDEDFGDLAEYARKLFNQSLEELIDHDDSKHRMFTVLTEQAQYNALHPSQTVYL